MDFVKDNAYMKAIFQRDIFFLVILWWSYTTFLWCKLVWNYELMTKDKILLGMKFRQTKHTKDKLTRSWSRCQHGMMSSLQNDACINIFLPGTWWYFNWNSHQWYTILENLSILLMSSYLVAHMQCVLKWHRQTMYFHDGFCERQYIHESDISTRHFGATQPFYDVNLCEMGGDGFCERHTLVELHNGMMSSLHERRMHSRLCCQTHYDISIDNSHQWYTIWKSINPIMSSYLVAHMQCVLKWHGQDHVLPWWILWKTIHTWKWYFNKTFFLFVIFWWSYKPFYDVNLCEIMN